MGVKPFAALISVVAAILICAFRISGVFVAISTGFVPDVTADINCDVVVTETPCTSETAMRTSSTTENTDIVTAAVQGADRSCTHSRRQSSEQQ